MAQDLRVQVAWAASRKKRSYFRALFTRLTARRGPRKAIVAVAAAILTTVYRMLRRGDLYADLGADHFERAQRTRLAARLTENSPNSASKSPLPTERWSRSGDPRTAPLPPSPCPSMAAGGLVGSLTGAGVPERDAQFYAEGVRRGGTLVTARVEDARASTAREILQRYKSVDPAVRGAAYREGGWTSFDESASAYTADQVAAERTRHVGSGV
jgi:hypothetical protein